MCKSNFCYSVRGFLFFCSKWFCKIFSVSDGRHFKPVYGKDLVESLINNADNVLIEIERPAGERLSLHQNKTTCLQGQIDLLRSHQAVQDQRINYALAREAEEADGRVNDR